CHIVRVKPLLLEDAQGRNADRQDCGLRIVRELEIFVRALEAKLAERKGQGSVRLRKSLPCAREGRMHVLAHTGVLGALPGEYECDFSHHLAKLATRGPACQAPRSCPYDPMLPRVWRLPG